MQFFYLWTLGTSAFLIFSGASLSTLIQISAPLFFCTIFILFINFFKINSYKFFAYFLFFLITILSLFGLTQSLTGSHAASRMPQLYGLSFYTASLAFFLIKKNKIGIQDSFKISNPLLLFTGPIALYVKGIKHKIFIHRLRYFTPFIIIGFFYYQIIAAPLTETFFLINSTDIVSSLLFATIFELFVYANFCGLSLIVYGSFGLLGFRVPLNFRQPFSSKNLIEFWRGWHTTLSAVLKELFYKPIRSKHSSAVALVGVFLASAMWHGTSFNFFIWGLFHALMFVVTIFLLKHQIRFIPIILLVITIILGRLLFADSDTERLIEKLMFTFDDFNGFHELSLIPNPSKMSILLGTLLISIEFFFQNFKNVSKRNYKHLRSPIVLFILSAITILFITNIGFEYAVYGQR